MCIMALLISKGQPQQYVKKFPRLINFSYIFSMEKYKTITIIEYFKRELMENNPHQSETKLTLSRTVSNSITREHLVEKFVNVDMITPKVAHDKESIEEYFGNAKVDFANKFIGGGSLGGGCVQE